MKTQPKQFLSSTIFMTFSLASRDYASNDYVKGNLGDILCGFDMLRFWKYALYAFCGLPCKEKTSKGEGEGFLTALREKEKASRQIRQRGNFR